MNAIQHLTIMHQVLLIKIIMVQRSFGLLLKNKYIVVDHTGISTLEHQGATYMSKANVLDELRKTLWMYQY